MRADLVALGVRFGWVPADEKEEPALAAVTERLRHEGEGILLIFDNATDTDGLKPYLPRGGSVRVLITSNAHAWRGIAEPVEIRVWPEEIGADYLIARTDREGERETSKDLSEALGGLPPAHEQAAAYCERLEISLAEYRRRFAVAPVQMLDTTRDASAEYHDKLTVAKTFALAIEEAGKLHPAEPLIVHAALLAPEPIPLFLFAEAREKFGEPLAPALAGDGLDEAVEALRTFALVDRKTIVDERDPAISTDTIRLHRLVREIAAAGCVGEAREQVAARWSRRWPSLTRKRSSTIRTPGHGPAGWTRSHWRWSAATASRPIVPKDRRAICWISSQRTGLRPMRPPDRSTSARSQSAKRHWAPTVPIPTVRDNLASLVRGSGS
jgi:hypothetical protein